MRNMARKVGVTLVLSSLFAGVLGSTAFASSVEYKGAYVLTLNNQYLSVADQANDDQFVSGGAMSNNGAEASVVNKDGFNSVPVVGQVFSGTDFIVMIRGCVSRTALPMDCSNYINAR